MDGALDEGQRAAMAAHLTTCPTCQQTLHDWQRLQRELRALPSPPPTPGMWRRVFHRVLRRTSTRPKVAAWHLWCGAAAVAACLVGAVLFWRWQTTPPQNAQTPVNLLVGYHADTMALMLGDAPTWHLVATNELQEGTEGD